MDENFTSSQQEKDPECLYPKQTNLVLSLDGSKKILRSILF